VPEKLAPSRQDAKINPKLAPRRQGQDQTEAPGAATVDVGVIVIVVIDF
jgi:hypothetical protein